MAQGNNKIYGAIARFETTPEVYEAAKKVRDAGFKNWDVFTPFPVHGLDQAMGLKRSIVPRFTLAGGCTGFFTGMLIVWFMNAYDYPLIVGGKPFFSPIFPFPVFYELTILLGAFGTLFGMFYTNRLPRHHHCLFDHPGFDRALDDKFFIAIESKDPKFNVDATQEFLRALGGNEVNLVEDK